jgi:hypothetical protein
MAVEWHFFKWHIYWPFACISVPAGVMGEYLAIGY